MQYVGDKVGRCNRENKCGYHYKPREYFEDNWWLKDDKANTDNYVRQPAKPEPPRNVTHECTSIESVWARCGDERWMNKITRWLARLLVPFIGEEAFLALIEKYMPGTVQDGTEAVIFWQIDIDGKVRTGKIMHYNEQTGKRIKDEDKPRFDWIHCRLERAGKLPPNFELRQSFFGEHLLKQYPDAPVMVFESEKTTMVAAGCFPEYVCLGAGGLHGISDEKCKVLEGRTVIFYADTDSTDKWRYKVNQIASTVRFAAYEVSDLLEKESTPEEREAGFDLCDYLIRELNAIK